MFAFMIWVNDIKLVVMVNIGNRLVEALAIAIVYIATAQLGFLAAISPGNVTVVWPPSGIALAAMLLLGYRAWAGVWLGSFLVNVLFFIFHDTLFSTAVTAGSSIAAGSTLQAFLATFLYRRMIGPRLPHKFKGVFNFMTIATLSCLIAATVGVSSLGFGSAIAWSNYPDTWLTWWLGDVVGILTVAPVLLMVGYKIRQGQGKKYLTFPLINGGVGLSLMAAYNNWKLGDQGVATFLGVSPAWLSWGLFAAGLLLAVLLASYIEYHLGIESALHESEERSRRQLLELETLYRTAPIGLALVDRNLRFLRINEKLAEIDGVSMDAHIGRTVREMVPSVADTIEPLYRRVIETGKPVVQIEIHGSTLVSIAPVKDEGHNITHFVAVWEDITKRKEIEEQLRHSQKVEVLGQLTGGIAHDFNNLLAIMMSNLEFLRERVSGDGEVQECFNDVLWSVARGGELTHRLLAFARRQTLKPAVIDLNDVVRGMGELFRRTLGATIRIEETLAPNMWKAFADRGELERALVNLAVNARDAMRSAGTLTLETRNAVLDEDYAEQYEEVTPGKYVLLAVADTGTGMPPEIMQRVFEPFFTTKEVGQGSGLGLSMVYGFVKQTGGHISIYSRIGQGTCVKLYLPRAPSSSSPVEREEDSSDVFPEDLGNKVVLVVEDEAKLRKVAVKMLDRLGLQSMQAETAKDALELLADTHVDVLFTDIELPGGMNGTELAEAAQKSDPNIKVLFTTGYARETTLHERGLHEHAPWLLKPYSHQELARELKALLAPAPH
jgi:PAS domain S-box-containing protein